MYCGDETGAFVGDCGYSTCRFGYGGEDIPKLVLPSYVGSDGSVGDNALRRYRPNLELRYIYRQKSEGDECIPPKPTPSSIGGNDAGKSGGGIGGTAVMTDGSEYYGDGCIVDYDAYEATWERAFVDLRVRDSTKWTSPSTVANSKHRELDRASPHPVCAVEAGHTCYGIDTDRDFGRKQRERLTELLFEKFDAPAIFIAPSPILSAFGVGRQTGLVVDVGGGGCRTTPVIDGLMCKNAQRRNGRGGEWLSDCAYRILTGFGGDGDGGGVEIHPRYAVGLMASGGDVNVDPTTSSTSSPGQRSPTRKKAKTTSESSSSSEKKSAKGDTADEEGDVEQRSSAPPAGSASHAISRKVVRYPADIATVRPTFHRQSVREVLYEIKTGFHVSTPHQRHSSSSSPAGARNSPRPPHSRNDDSDTTGTGGAGAGDDDDSDGDGSSNSKRHYELPDGTRIDLGVGRPAAKLCTLPELHFEDLSVRSSVPASTSASAGGNSGGKSGGGGDRGTTLLGNSDWTRTLSTLPLHLMAHEALSQTDVDARKELCGNIILCGAGSLHDGCERRLSREMSDACPTSYRCRVIAARPIERRFSSWIGASVLTSLGSFQQLWLSRAEYEEYGASMGCQRFP